MAENWRDKEKSLGVIQVNDKKKVVYDQTDNCPEILMLISSCTCLTAKYSKENKTITAFLTARKVPKHLREQGWYKVRKHIKVYYKGSDQKVDKLYIEAVIKIKERLL